MTTRTICRAALLAVGMTALAGGVTAQDKKDYKPEDIKEIMNKGHKGKKAYLNEIGNALKAEKWDEVKKHTDIMKVYGETLPTFDPPKGEKASWKKLSGKYKDDTTAMSKSADKKDAAATEKYLKSIQNSCKGCHSQHKG